MEFATRPAGTAEQAPGGRRRVRRAIVAASLAVFLIVGGIAYGLGSVARSTLESEVLRAGVQGADLVGSLGGRLPELTPGGMRRGFNDAQITAADRALAHAKKEGALASLILVNAAGEVVFADDHTLIGTSQDLDPDIQHALDGQDVSSASNSSNDLLDRIHGPALDAYVPLVRSGKVFGVLELSQPLAPFTARISRTELNYYFAIGGGGFLVWLLLLPLVVRFARLVEKNFEPGRRRRLRELRRSIASRDLEVHYQPIVEAATGRLVGAEALVRMRRGSQLLAPAQFLPLAESSGLIAPLTEFVLDQAVAQAARWRADGLALAVSVNLSAATLHQAGLAEEIETVLARHAFPASLLHTEITETAVIEDDVAATSSVAAIARLGVAVSLDDFGTGYSSMTRVGSLPISELKIDRSFISDLTAERRPLVRGMIELAHTLGLRVVAEGVEDRATVVVLREMGCELLQGYYFSRPMPAAAFERWRNVPPIASEEAPELMIEADLDGHFTNVTLGLQRCLGYSRAELLARPYLELVHPEDLEATSAAAAALVVATEVVHFETRFRARDGAWHPFVWSARSDGCRIHAIAREVGRPTRDRYSVSSRSLIPA